MRAYSTVHVDHQTQKLSKNYDHAKFRPKTSYRKTIENETSTREGSRQVLHPQPFFILLVTNFRQAVIVILSKYKANTM